ncbi:class I SAM-dependent methyltransferase [Piscinibacter sp. XHJ-5]|uniref:class I SAM-dependent methyltransferase n=1 Tax=Piscinibacter sp. XHJ-5 TaxID=3037797 RepID=UPI002452DF8A|nr:class I SAM-dependent methyltransferase [Piscinibacter sp. XHJ-5]
MHDPSAIDPGRHIDWSRTSGDYAAHRPGPPQRLYDMLSLLGIGLPGQRLLDIGTGTGLVAREFARRGAVVAGTDIAAGQIAAAQEQAQRDGLSIDFQVAPAEACPHPDASFDVVTASQCWMYFDVERTCTELRRVLRPGGMLVTTHFSWLPQADALARASEQLVLHFNPAWQGAHWDGRVPSVPSWTVGRAQVAAMFWFDEAVPFTREAWRGRMRACRGVGATLSADEVEAFDAEHARLLERIAPPRFTVWHRVDAHLIRL